MLLEPMDIDAICRAELVAVATAYAERTKTSLVTVSKRFHGGTRFFEELKSGGCTVTLSKLKHIVQDFSDEWPPDLPWPKSKIVRQGNRRGFVYAATWESRPQQVRIGYSWALDGRLKMLKQEAHRAKTKLVVVGHLRGIIHNERSVHRYLTDQVETNGLRSWYPMNEPVKKLLDEILSPKFQWDECVKLRYVDTLYTETGGGRRRKTG